MLKAKGNHLFVSELQRLKMGDAIINKHRMNPFKTHLPDISKYSFNTKKYDRPILPVREKDQLSYLILKLLSMK